MEDENEEEEYVKFINGKMIKCTSNYLGKIISKHTVYKNIVKHSKDTIDLIEVGDYVNGEPVEEVICTDDEFEITTTTEYLTNLEDIKSIVTKEQFKQVQYKV